MKTKKLDYTFHLKDLEATKARHAVQISKVRKQAKWDSIMDSTWLEDIEYMVKTGWEDMVVYGMKCRCLQKMGAFMILGAHKQNCERSKP